MTDRRLFAHAEQTAYEWLRVIADQLGTDDVHEAYQVLRPWLHLLRDRLSVPGAAHLAAQLPELLRGVFYDGWRPSEVPVRIHAEEYRLRFQEEARIPAAEVAVTAAAVTTAMRALFSPGQLATAFEQLPGDLRAILDPAPIGRTR
ncbi:hypothetical protein GCM10029964_086060 [Kibdelosporangium lantanae]